MPETAPFLNSEPQETAAPAPLPGRMWIRDLAAARVGKTWRQEDQEALARNLSAAERLTAELIELARKTASERREKTDEGRQQKQ